MLTEAEQAAVEFHAREIATILERGVPRPPAGAPASIYLLFPSAKEAKKRDKRRRKGGRHG